MCSACTGPWVSGGRLHMLPPSNRLCCSSYFFPPSLILFFLATATQSDSRTSTPQVTLPRTITHTLRRCPVQAVSDSAAAARSAGAATHISRVPVDPFTPISGYFGFICFVLSHMVVRPILVFVHCGHKTHLGFCPMWSQDPFWVVFPFSYAVVRPLLVLSP